MSNRRQTHALKSSASNLYFDFKEFGYLEGYFLRISIASTDIVFTVYNLEALDGKRYECQLTLSSLYKMNYKFKQLHSIRDIYDYIVKLIEENYYKITPDITNLKLTLLIRGNFNQNTEVQVYLTCFERKYGNAKNQQEYINILANEIKRLRSTSKIIDE